MVSLEIYSCFLGIAPPESVKFLNFRLFLNQLGDSHLWYEYVDEALGWEKSGTSIVVLHV